MTVVCEPISVDAGCRRLSWLKATCAIFALACICFFFHLGYGPLAGTEGHRAITAEQMFENGNYLLPKLYGHLYLMKPPLAYWLIGISEKILGPNGWSWRLPSAMASSILAAGICAITATWFDALSGFTAGFAFIAIIPLWSQNRSADIDALNHVGCVLGALAIIDLGRRGKTAGRAWIVMVAAIGIAVSLLSKGPAGLPLVMGAFIGPALANRTTSPLRSKASWLSLLLGAIPLVIWAGLAYHQIGSALFSSDTSGTNEIGRRLAITNFHHILPIIGMPFIVLAYGMPISGLLVLPVIPRFVRSFDSDKQYLIRGLFGCVVVTFVIQFLSSMSNPRYAFLNLPILCPLAGALVYGMRHLWQERGRREIPIWCTVITVIYCMIAIVVLLITRRMEVPSERGDTAIAMGGFACAIAAAMGIGLVRNAKVFACIAVAAVCASAMTYGFYKTHEENIRSARSESAPLAARVTAGYPLITWNVLWSQPELFYYAHLHPTVEHPLPTDALPSPAWLVLDDDEWALWQKNPRFASHLTNVQLLRPYKHYAYVCWYSK